MATVFALCLFLTLTSGKTALSTLLGMQHSFLPNVFFINVTFLGDGIFVLCLCAFVFLGRNKKRVAAFTLYCCLLAAGLVQLVKNITQQTLTIYFEPGRLQYAANGNGAGGYNIFPSGHTAIAFALATAFVLMLPNRKWQLPVLLAALLVGYSRIYLAANTLQNVVLGSLLGTISTVVVHVLYRRRINIFKPVKTVRKKNFSVGKDASLQPV